ncbi:MAG: acyl-CoA dehydrogenase N-terminal domain-containing protein, partial [Venatoribacter sp.]
MPAYKAPLRDIKFVMDELLDTPAHYASIPEFAEVATPETVDMVINAGAQFCEEVLSPLYREGDKGCVRHEDGSVTTPKGFKEAYKQYVEGGWPSLSHKEEHGGQGLPESLGIVISEMVGSSNWAWGMYPG